MPSIKLLEGAMIILHYCGWHVICRLRTYRAFIFRTSSVDDVPLGEGQSRTIAKQYRPETRTMLHIGVDMWKRTQESESFRGGLKGAPCDRVALEGPHEPMAFVSQLRWTT